MTDLNTSNIDSSADDMALLADLLGDDSGITEKPDLDLSSEEGDLDMNLDDLDLDLDEGSLLQAASAAPTAEPEVPGDDDADLDLDLDESALMAAVSEVEGVNSVEDLPEPAAAAPAVAAEPAPAPKKAVKPTTARTTYTNAKASEVLRSRLGGDVSNELVLEFADAELSEGDLKAKQAGLLDLLNVRPHQSKDSSTQKKVAEKVVMLFAYMKNGGKFNEVMHRTFKVLAKDGYIQMGKQGNLFLDLLQKPYSIGTANAQGGQMMQMLPLLKIALPDAANKGRLVINPDSVIFARMVGLLGLEEKSA